MALKAKSMGAIKELVRAYIENCITESSKDLIANKLASDQLYNSISESINEWLDLHKAEYINEDTEDPQSVLTPEFLETTFNSVYNEVMSVMEADDSDSDCNDDECNEDDDEDDDSDSEEDDDDDDEDDSDSEDDDDDDEDDDSKTKEVKEDQRILNSIVESILNENDDSDSKDEDDEDDDDLDEDDDSDSEDEEDDDDLDEALTKHKISKTDSIIAKRKRATDPKYKLSRRRTLKKAEARGGRVVNKKLSKALKKSHKMGFGKRWESEQLDTYLDRIDDVLKEATYDKEDLVKRLINQVKTHKQAIQESLNEAMQNTTAFGTLNEAESASLLESFTELLSENIDRAVSSITDSLLTEMENYKDDVIVPTYSQHINDYIEKELVPAVNEDVNRYLDYVINERIDEIMESGKILKSRKTTQLEAFTENLLDLIEHDLKFIPEQEDGYIDLENKYNLTSKALHEARVQRIKAEQKAQSLENELWAEQNMPSSLSEAAKEKVRENLKLLEAEDTEEYITEAKKIFNDSLHNPNQYINIAESENKKKKTINESIVERTLQFMQKKSV
jgi:hypothetical protein